MFMYGGVYANLLEFFIYWTTFSRFLEPTYFSFFGLCNIQRYGKLLEMDDICLWNQLAKVVNDETSSNNHHFDNSENFSYDGKNIRMLDYGGRGIRSVIKRHGRRLFKELDPTFIPDDV